jgi:hypothetical protein
MAEFSEVWLQNQGLNLPSQTLRQFSDTLQAVLEMRVGTVLASRLNDVQLDEFENILSHTDDDDIDDARLKWLEKNYPGYSKVVSYQKAKLSKQLRTSTDKVMLIKHLSKAEVPST